jgi:ribosomal protein S18 acetylase RimI-like enzyme
MGISIREATRDDYESICELYAEADAFHAEALPALFRVADGPARTEYFISHLIQDEDVALLVAEAGGELVGVVHVVERAAPDFPCVVPRRYAQVDSLAVKASFRRQGTGRSLMEEARRWAAGRGLPRIELTVWEFNQGAMALYEELGYETANRKMWRSTD